jgi:hypothetical protein
MHSLSAWTAGESSAKGQAFQPPHSRRNESPRRHLKNKPICRSEGEEGREEKEEEEEGEKKMTTSNRRNRRSAYRVARLVWPGDRLTRWRGHRATAIAKLEERSHPWN